MIYQKFELTRSHTKRQIAYAESGNILSENIIFCIPGILETKETFQPIHEYELSHKDAHIVSVDICGRGASSPLEKDENYRMSVYLEDIKLLLSSIIQEKAKHNSKTINIYMLGTSMGGLLIFYLLQEFGVYIKGICLNDIALTLKWFSILELSKPIRNSHISLQELAQTLKVAPEVLMDVQKNEHFDLPYKSDLIGMHFHHLIDKFKGILFLIYGEQSIICTSDVVLEFKLRFPHATYLKVLGSPHPVALNAEIAQKIFQKFKLETAITP